MKKIKNKRIKINETTSEENEVRTFIIIVLAILGLSILVYFITDFVKSRKNTDNTEVGIIDYDKLVVGTLLNAPYDNYYVLVYNKEDTKAPLFETLYTNFKETNDKKIYTIDLNEKLNSKYYNVNNDGKSNPKAQKISELNFGDSTLIEVKNAKIVKYVEGYDSILKLLK